MIIGYVLCWPICGDHEERVFEGVTFIGISRYLAAKTEWAWTHDKEMRPRGKEARREFEEKYTAERNYKMLMEIYRKAMETKGLKD